MVFEMENTLPKYVVVENRVKQAIRDGDVTHKLPGERVLAKDLGVSYMTIRKAIDNLVMQGVLYRVPARGTYVDQRSGVRRLAGKIGRFLESSIS